MLLKNIFYSLKIYFIVAFHF